MLSRSTPHILRGLHTGVNGQHARGLHASAVTKALDNTERTHALLRSGGRLGNRVGQCSMLFSTFGQLLAVLKEAKSCCQR